MSADLESDLKLEIAHVLTIDVVAYSTLLIHEQSRVMNELTKAVRNTPRFRSAEADGKLTRLPTGDGMALVFFGDPEAPIDCAMQIGAELKGRPDIRVRMGIHSGPVNQVIDVNDRSNVAGAGIDVAQRVMDCGDAGHILLSKRVADDLAPYPRWNRHLHDLGECEVKHGRKINVFNFYTDALGNSAVPQRLRSGANRQLPRTAKKKLYWAGAAVLLLAIAFLLVLLLRPQQPSKQSLAVLPFAELSAAKDQEYFSDGLSEQIINSLGKIPGLFVMARSSSFAFKDKNADARIAGRQLGVTHILEGSISRSSGRVRVNADLVQVSTGYQLWAENYDLAERDVLSFQTIVAQKVARALQLQLGLKESSDVAKLPTRNPEAYDLYLRGRYLLNKRTPDSLQKALALFKEAVANDTAFALGRVGIADAYILLAKIGAMPVQESVRQAWPQVSSALATDSELADAYATRGVLLNDFEWNWPAADADYRKALALDPSSTAAHLWYARHLAQLGRAKEALEEISKAQKQDPLSAMIRVTEARIHLSAHRPEEAIDPCKKALELEANFASAYQSLAHAYAQRGDYAQAIDAARKYVELSEQSGWARLELAYVYAVAGNRTEAEKIVSDVISGGLPFSSYDMAAIASAYGDTADALRWLERAIEQRSVDVIWIRVDPRLDSLRDAPAFQALVSRMTARR